MNYEHFKIKFYLPTYNWLVNKSKWWIVAYDKNMILKGNGLSDYTDIIISINFYKNKTHFKVSNVYKN